MSGEKSWWEEDSPLEGLDPREEAYIEQMKDRWLGDTTAAELDEIVAYSVECACAGGIVRELDHPCFCLLGWEAKRRARIAMSAADA